MTLGHRTNFHRHNTTVLVPTATITTNISTRTTRIKSCRRSDGPTSGTRSCTTSTSTTTRSCSPPSQQSIRRRRRRLEWSGWSWWGVCGTMTTTIGTARGFSLVYPPPVPAASISWKRRCRSRQSRRTMRPLFLWRQISASVVWDNVWNTGPCQELHQRQG